MTISFSGPSSGIDTNAWVEALVKMKQASVNTLEQKKETLVATTSILDNVKSFFASFKSVLTNVTQSNLGIASFDLFIQNLVETSNADVVTASVTTEAQEANYEVNVNQVATETEATSAFLTNIITTTESIATHNSLLSSIGIGTGKVGFNVGGVQREITLQSNDTIASFLDKLDKIGVDASYDSVLGVFSINLGIGDINDDLDGDGVNNTGIKEALFLTNVNSGYSSDLLELSSLEDFVINATANAKMSLFGVTDGEYTITDKDGNETILCADVEDTFQKFFDEIERFGLHAEFNEEGMITIDTTDGCLISGALAEQLGIVIDDQSVQTDTKAASTVGAFSREVISVEYGSTLEEIGAMVNDSDRLLILNRNNSVIAEVTSLTKSSTVDDLFSVLAEHGIEGKLENNVISLNSPLGYIIGGEIADNIGVATEQTSTTTIKTGNTTSSTAMVSYVASATDWVSDCLWDVWDSYSDDDKVLKVTHTDRYGTDQSYYYTVVAKNSIDSNGMVVKGTQFQDIADWYHSLDPTATFVFNDNGQIFIDSNDCFYFEGRIAQYLGIGGHTDTYTWTEGITTTSSSDTVSYRVRKTDYISDTLWDNGWLSYSDSDKVISAYSITVDHTTANNSVNNPDGAEGNYVEDNSTYQHTVQTLIGTFTIKQGETTYEDLGYWFTHTIDQTAAFTINNDGTISIDSNNNFHLEGKVITDLGLGISTYQQSWTTGLQETQSTSSVTFAAKMTDFISDTYTSSQWANANRTISVYSNTIDHSDGPDGNGVYQVTVQTKLTDIVIDQNTTFNSLRDQLANYNIHLSMTNGVLTMDSSAANYLVEEEFMNHQTVNGVDVMTRNTSYSGGKTSILDHFGITYDTLHQSWTTGTAATESTAIVNYAVKATDYMSDTFTDYEWTHLANYTDSAGNSHDGKSLAIMHSYIDHANQRTVIECKTVITITENTKFGDYNNAAVNDSAHSTIIVNGTTIAGKTLADVLKELGSGDDRNRINMWIDDGVLRLDSNCCWIEGSIADHYGIRFDTVSQNWTTGTASTESTGVVQHVIKMTDYISDTFRGSDWAAIDKNIIIKETHVDHENQRTVVTEATRFTIDNTWTFQALADKLATLDNSDNRNNITLWIDDGRLRLDSDCRYIDCAIIDHFTSIQYNTISQNWTTGTASTESTGVVQFYTSMEDYISDTFTKYDWDHLANWTDTAGNSNGGKTIAIMHAELNHANQTTVITRATTINIDTNTTFQDLADMLDDYGITLNITNGVVQLDSDKVSGLNNSAYYIEGRISDHWGVRYDTTTMVWTTGIERTESTGTINYNSQFDDYISDTFNADAWANVNKVLTIKHEYLDHNTQQMVVEDAGYITVTNQMTFAQLRGNTSSDPGTAANENTLANWGIILGFSNGAVTLDSNIVNVKNREAYYVTGEIADHFGITTDTITQTWTYGSTSTSAASSFLVQMTDYISDTFTQSDWNSANKNVVIYQDYLDHTSQTVKTRTIATVTTNDTMTFTGLRNSLRAATSNDLDLSITDGIVELDSNNRYYIGGDVPAHWGLGYTTITQSWTTGYETTKSTGSISYNADNDDYIKDMFNSDDWSHINKDLYIRYMTYDRTTNTTSVKTQATFTVTDTMQLSLLKRALYEDYNMSFDVTGGAVSIDGYYWVEGELATHMGLTYNTISQTWTYGASVSSASQVYYTINAQDTIYDLCWEYWNDSSFSKKIYLTACTWDENTNSVSDPIIMGTYTVTQTTTFNDLCRDMGSRYGISMGLQNGVIGVRGSQIYQLEGDIITALGLNKTTRSQTITVAQTSTSTEALKYSGALMNDKISNMVGYGTLGNKNIYILRDYYEVNQYTANNDPIKTQTVATISTSDLTWDGLNTQLAAYNLQQFAFSSGYAFLTDADKSGSNTYRNYYMSGDLLDFLYLIPENSSTTITYTVTAKDVTASAALTATIKQDSSMGDWGYDGKYVIKKWNPLEGNATTFRTVTASSTTTFAEFFDTLRSASNGNLQCTVSDGRIFYGHTEGYYLESDKAALNGKSEQNETVITSSSVYTSVITYQTTSVTQTSTTSTVSAYYTNDIYTLFEDNNMQPNTYENYSLRYTLIDSSGNVTYVTISNERTCGNLSYDDDKVKISGAFQKDDNGTGTYVYSDGKSRFSGTIKTYSGYKITNFQYSYNYGSTGWYNLDISSLQQTTATISTSSTETVTVTKTLSSSDTNIEMKNFNGWPQDHISFHLRKWYNNGGYIEYDTYELRLNTGSTVNDLNSFFDSNGFNLKATITNGKIKFETKSSDPTKWQIYGYESYDHYQKLDWSTLSQTKVTKTEACNNCTPTNPITHTANNNTRMFEITDNISGNTGYTIGTGYVYSQNSTNKLYEAGELKTIVINRTDKIKDVSTKLQAVHSGLGISQGKVYISHGVGLGCFTPTSGISIFGLSTNANDYHTEKKLTLKDNNTVGAINIDTYLTNSNKDKVTLKMLQESQGYTAGNISYYVGSNTGMINYISSNAEYQTIKWNTTESVDTFLNKIKQISSGSAFNATIDDSTHKVTITPKKQYKYYLNIAGDTSKGNPLKLSNARQESVVSGFVCNSSSGTTLNHYIHDTSTLSDLGVNSNQVITIVQHTTNAYQQYAQDCVTPNGHTIKNTNTTLTFTWTTSETFSSFISKINAKTSSGLSAQFAMAVYAQGGKVYIGGSKTSYVYGMTYDLLHLFSMENANFTATQTYSLICEANSNKTGLKAYLNDNTRVSDMGLNGNQEITITKHINDNYVANCDKANNCVTHIHVTWKANQTFASFRSEVAAATDGAVQFNFNAADRTLEFTGNEYYYVSNIQSELASYMKLPLKENYTYGKSYNYTLKYKPVCNADGGSPGVGMPKQDFVMFNERNIKLKNIIRPEDTSGLTSETLTFVLHTNTTYVADNTKATNCTKTVTITWTSSETLAEFENKVNTILASEFTSVGSPNGLSGGYGVTFNVDKQTGKWSISTGENLYLSGVSNGLKTRLGINPSHQTYNYTLNYRSDADTNAEKTYLNERNTKLQKNLGINSNQTMTFVVHTNNTYVTDNTKASDCLRTITVTWSTGQTLEEFENNVNLALYNLWKDVGSPRNIHDDNNGAYANALRKNNDPDYYYHNSDANYRINNSNYTELASFGGSNDGRYYVKFYVDRNTGKWQITGDENVYLQSVSNQLESVMKLSGAKKENGTYGTSYQYTINYRADADNTIDKTYLNERNTYLHDITINSAQTMVIMLHTNNTFAEANTDPADTWGEHNSKSKINNVVRSITVTWTTTQTLGEFEAAVRARLATEGDQDGICHYDMTFSVDPENGKWKFTGNEYTYVESISDKLESYMKLAGDKKQNGTYGRSYNYTLRYRANTDRTNDYTYVNERNTKLHNLSINSAQTMDIVLHTNNTFAEANTDASSISKINNVVRTITVTWTTAQTLGEFEAAVRARLATEGDQDGICHYDMTFSVDAQTGKWKFTGNEYTYVNRIDSALENYMKLTGDKKQNGTYGRSYNYTLNYRADADNNTEYAYLNERNTKLHNMSINSAQTMTFVVHTNNTFAQDNTDGMDTRVDVTKTVTVTWTSSQTLEEFENAVNQKLYETWVSVGRPNNVYDTTNTAYSDLLDKRNNTIYYHDQSYINNTLNTFNGGNDGRYYIKFSVDPENGKWKIIGDEHTYLYDVSDALENYMKLTGDKKEQGTYGQSYGYDIIYRADADTNIGGTNPGAIDFTYLNERNATLNNLSYVNEYGQTISTTQSQTMDIVIHINNTYAQDNTKSEIQQKNISSTSTYYTTTTTGITQTSSDAVTYYELDTAIANHTFAELGINTSQAISVHGSDGEKLGEFRMGDTSTIADFLTAVNNLNTRANARLNNGVITISNGYVSGSVASALGLNMQYYGETTTGIAQTSASSITYNKVEDIATSTTLAELGYTTGNVTEVFDRDGFKLGEFTLAHDATVGNFLASINDASTSGNAVLENGVIRINSGYISGALAEQFGLNMVASTYTTTIANTQTSSSAVVYNVYTDADATTTLGELNIDTTNEVSVYDKYGNYRGGIRLTESSTLQSLVDGINNAFSGANATINGNAISIKNGYVTGDIASALGFSTKTSTTSGETIIKSATSSIDITRTNGTTADNNTTMAELGLSTNSYKFNIYDRETEKTISVAVKQDMTLGSLAAALTDAGITTTFSNGKLYVGNNLDENYITSMSSNLKNYLRFEAGKNKTYSVPLVTLHTSTTANVEITTPTYVNDDTKLIDLGLTRTDYLVKKSDGTQFVLTKNDNLIDAFAEQGFDIEIDNRGYLSISSTDPDLYITSMNNALKNALNIDIGANGTARLIEHDAYASTESERKTIQTDKTLNADSTLADFGLSSASFTMGSGVVVNINSNDKIVAKLESVGLQPVLRDGTLTIVGSGNTYIKAMSSELQSILNIGIGDGYTYNVSNAVSYGSSNSRALQANVLKSISETTTLSNLGMSNESVTTNTGTIYLSANDNIVEKLRNAGLGVSVVNGKISISGNENIYVTGMSSNLQNALKVNVGENNTWERNVYEHVNPGSIDAVTRTITVTWTYSQLGTEDNQAKPETMAQFISDINASLAQATTQYKSLFNLSEDFTISAYVDGEGKFHFTGDEYTYVNRVDDFLANALKIKSVTKEGSSYGRSYSYDIQYANNSDKQTQYTYINYDNMRLQNFDIYQDQYITIVTNNNTTFSADTTKNGTVLFDQTSSTYVITWTVGSTGHTRNSNGTYNNNNNAITDGETFEELKYELEHFGVLNNLCTEASAVLGNDIYKINVTINADNTISLVGNEYTYIKGISSDLQSKIKILGREGEGYYYSTYDYDIHFNNDGYTKQNTTLLNYDSRLDNLSIMADMTMTIETPDGGKSIVIDHDTTMQELKERLFSDYGIDISIEDKTGRITFTPTRADEGYYILGMDTELKNGLKIITGENGVYTINSEQIVETSQPGVYTTTVLENVTTTLGTYGTSTLDNYDNSASRNLRYEDENNIIKMSTRISRIVGYENGNGNITVHYADGLEQNISIRESMTIGQLCEILKDYGVNAEVLAGGRMTFRSNDGTYVKSAEGGSNLLDVLNVSDVSIKVEGTTVITSKTLNRKEERENKYFAGEDTFLSEFSEELLQANGIITFALNDKYKSITITSDDTFGTLISKFKEKGLNAKIESGKFSISSGFDTFSIIQEATTSSLAAIIKLNERVDLGGFAMTERSKTIISTTTISDTKSLSIANYADEDTEFSKFNILGGTLSIFLDGKKAGINLSASDTTRTLQDKLRAALGQAVNGNDEDNLTVKFDENGYLKIYQKDANIIVGSNEDTSNFGAITGIFTNNGTAESTRCFYKINEYTKVTEAGIFRNGDVTAGSFIVGDATITIDENTTIGELASQINTNADSNVTAYWDSIKGEFRIKSNSTGDFYINFESGTSNFTDVLGFTKTSYDVEKDKTVSSINTDTQKHGKNARVTINGASYTSVSNTMGSDVTGIKGLTINVKGMSAGESTILSVKKDVQSLALAVSDIVDAYNALIDNINNALNSKSELRNDSELKRLRNHIKSIMTGTNKNSSIFKNIVAIGIVTDTADPTNLSVGSGIYKLSLDYEKFAKAFEADSESVRTLLIGRVDSEGNLIEEGILTKLEALIDESIDAAGGYFERTEDSFDRQIDRIDNKIVKGNEAIERYRERLEKKYMSMNILNSNIQTQYQVYFV